MKENFPDSPQAEQAEEFSEEFSEITGLEDDDVTDFALAISGLENVQTDPSLLKLSGAIYATKPVTTDQVVAAAELIAEKNGETLELTISVGEGADFIEFPKDPGSPEMYAAVVTGESSTLVFFGDRASVEASLARKSGSVPESLKAPSQGLVEGQQGWISIIIPESFRAQIAGMSAQGEQMIRGLSKINSLQSVGVGMKAGESLDIALGLNLGSEEDAAAIQAIINNQVISFAKMMLGAGTPEPLPLLDSLAASHAGDRAVLSINVTLKDIQLLQEQLVNMIPTGNTGVTPSAVQ